MRSLQLDPSLSWGHLTLASVKKLLDWDWEGAESHYRQALTLGPNCEAAHFLYARFLAAMHRPAEARALAARACEIAPLCPGAGPCFSGVEYCRCAVAPCQPGAACRQVCQDIGGHTTGC